MYKTHVFFLRTLTEEYNNLFNRFSKLPLISPDVYNK